MADLEILVRGGGGPGPSDIYKKIGFFYFYFTVIKWLLSKKTIIFQGSRGGPTDSRGGPTFSRGGGGDQIAYSL